MDDETRKKMNVEETFAAIDKIIGRLEKGDGSLEEAFADYEEGRNDREEDPCFERRSGGGNER